MVASWIEHADLAQAIFVLAITIIGWLAVRTLKKIDINQTILFKKYEQHETRLAHLEGAHEARTGAGCRPK